MSTTIKRVRKDPDIQHGLRLSPSARKESILQSAINISVFEGYLNITRDMVADAANVTNGLVSHYWGCMPDLREQIIKHAVEREILPIIAQGISHQSEHTRNINPELKSRVIKYLSN